MTDVTVPLVLRSTPRLPTLRIALPSLDLYEAVSDKYRLFQLARAAGVRVPETVPVSRAALGSLEGRDWRYPSIIKPRKSTMRLDSGTRKRSVRYAADRGELVRTVESMLIDATDELLIQEYISGEGAGVFGLYEHGRPRLFFAHRRIREKPPSGGISVLCESVRPPAEGLAAARGLLDSLGWHGVAMVEFKIDESGHMWLIEINARFWGSLQLAVDCGADFPGSCTRSPQAQVLKFPPIIPSATGCAGGWAISTIYMPACATRAGHRLCWTRLGPLENS